MIWCGTFCGFVMSDNVEVKEKLGIIMMNPSPKFPEPAKKNIFAAFQMKQYHSITKSSNNMVGT